LERISDKQKILIVDDSEMNRSILADMLGDEYEILEAENGLEAVSAIQKYRTEIDLVLLDIGLPFRNGYHWCAEIRKLSQVPIVFLSSASDNMNVVMAMNMGGDDFIAKPFDLEVLAAKVQALLRRTYDFGSAAPLLGCRGAVLDTGDNTLRYEGQLLELSRNEYRILQVLLEQKGKTVSRDTLMRKLWETDSFVDENTLTVNMARLRRKLEGIGLTDFVHTKKGLGYLIEG